VDFLLQLSLGEIPTSAFKTKSLYYVLKSSWVSSAAPISVEYSKLLLSNLALTVFVSYLVDLIKQIPVVCPQRRKSYGDKDLSGLHFLSLITAK
jgi:hypothetical protein